jgi:hypothetical protein
MRNDKWTSESVQKVLANPSVSAFLHEVCPFQAPTCFSGRQVSEKRGAFNRWMQHYLK